MWVGERFGGSTGRRGRREQFAWQANLRRAVASNLQMPASNPEYSGAPARRSHVPGWELRGGTLNRPCAPPSHLQISNLHSQGRNVPSRPIYVNSRVKGGGLGR